MKCGSESRSHVSPQTNNENIDLQHHQKVSSKSKKKKPPFLLHNPHVLPTLDRPLKRLFAWFTREYLVDYCYVFIFGPICLTCLLAFGFLWLQELTILDAKKLYTPASAPSWTEERILKEAIIFCLAYYSNF